MEAIQRITQGRAVAVAIGRQCDAPSLHAGVLIGALAWSLAGALFLSSVWLLVRRLTGALESPLDGGVLITVGVCAVLCAGTARLLWHRATDRSADAVRRLGDWLPTVALVFVATSASMPGSPVAAVVLLWTLIAAEEVAAALLARLRIGPNRQGSIDARSRIAFGMKTRPPAAESSAEREPTASYEVRQHQTRERACDGRELVRGTLRSGFAVGQRTAIEHIVFCPMLTAVPRVTATALDESDCSVRATHIYRYGARLEIRLREPCEGTTEVLVRYEAHV
jgi:hypothetical protein